MEQKTARKVGAAMTYPIRSITDSGMKSCDPSPGQNTTESAQAIKDYEKLTADYFAMRGLATRLLNALLVADGALEFAKGTGMERGVIQEAIQKTEGIL